MDILFSISGDSDGLTNPFDQNDASSLLRSMLDRAME